ncbi:NUDIX hydrolase [Methyloglobulus sp.]|uniref:NUDIX hydrolase n=1 Tax=Methyloglobulus sp. TaxID=2518622 RepID=UPI0032B8387E
MVWKPHVTVAAIIERDGRFLLVEEHTSSGLQFNQPAGHLEENESLIAAVKREVFEETAWQFEPEYLVSIQLWRKKPRSPSFLRCCFAGQCHSHDPNQPLDEGIVATHWLTREEILLQQRRLRSPLVSISVDEYLSGQSYSLALLKSLIDIEHG